MAFADEVKKNAGAPKFFVDIVAGGATYRYCTGKSAAPYVAWPMRINDLTIGASQLARVTLQVLDKEFTWSNIVIGSDTIDFPVTITLDYNGATKEIFDGQVVGAVRDSGYVIFQCAGSGSSLRQCPRVVYRSEFANVIRGKTVTVGAETFTFS